MPTFLDKRISELNQISTIADTDIVPIVDVSDTAAGVTKKAEVSDLKAIFGTTDASSMTSGTLNDARLSSNVTLEGNSFNAANKLLKLDINGKVPNSLLNSVVTLMGNTFNGLNQLVKLDLNGFLPSLNGSNLTTLNASELTSGTVNDARLSNNVMFKGKIITTIGSAGNTSLTNAMTDNWFVTNHSTGIVTFTLTDSPVITPQAYFKIFTNSNQQVNIVTGPSTTIYYFMGSVPGGSSFAPTAQRGRVIDLYCIATNTFIMTGDLV
jgi:hypothetical protein